MEQIWATVNSTGRVTIPRRVRQRLGVATPSQVVFVVADDGMVSLRVPRYPTVATLAGAAGALDRALTWEEMRQIAREDHLGLP